MRVYSFWVLGALSVRNSCRYEDALSVVDEAYVHNPLKRSTLFMMNDINHPSARHHTAADIEYIATALVDNSFLRRCGKI
jgi:hypothetical protein